MHRVRSAPPPAIAPRRSAGSIRAPTAVAVLLAVAACGQAPPGAGQSAAPTAVISASTTEGPAPLSIAFDGSGSSHVAGTIISFAWQFGDGTAASGAAVAHTYDAPGSYLARLTVTDERGTSNSATLPIVVTAGDGEPGGDDGSVAATARFTHAATEAAFDLPGFLIPSAVDAALEATRQTGTATLTGTLTETSPQAFTYSSDPADSLRVVRLDGREWEIVFNAMPQGTFDGDGDRFLRRPHLIDVRVTSNEAAGALDVTVTSQPGQSNHAQVGALVGSFAASDGTRWRIDVALERYHRSEVDFGGNELESILAMSGSVEAEAHGIAATVQRYHRYKLVNTAENVDHRFDHAIGRGGATYRLVGRVFVGLLDSRPVDRDQWVIEGGLLENGVAVGQFTVAEDPTGLSVSLEVDGERIQLYAVSYF